MDEQQRRTFAELAALALSAMVDAVVIADLQGRIRAINPAAERFFGYSAGELNGQHIQLFAVEGHEWEPRDVVARVSTGDVHHNPEATREAKDGRLLQASITWAPMRGADGEVDGMVGVFRDTGGAMRLDAALQQRRAADLDAGFISSLFALALDLEEAVTTRSFALVNAARDRIGSLISELRTDAEQLATLDLDPDESVADALRQVVDKLIPAATGISLNLREVAPSAEVAEALVYVATEAVINAVRHSAATKIAIDLRESAGTLVLVVQDNGGGFDPERVGRGLGLGRMKRWASRASGEVAVFSVPGMGTTVRAAMPGAS